jgi:hypothetical protein
LRIAPLRSQDLNLTERPQMDRRSAERTRANRISAEQTQAHGQRLYNPVINHFDILRKQTQVPRKQSQLGKT